MRIIIVLTTSLVALAIMLTGCFGAPTAKSPTTVNVAAFMFPGGGADPSVISLYKAALEVNRTATDFEVRIISVSPSEQELFMGKMGIGPAPQTSPNLAALEQALGQDPAPDVVLFSALPDFASALEKELLQPLDTYFRSDRNVKPEDYFPGAIEALSDSGRLYALPLSVVPTVLMYDKRVFDEAGLGAPDPNWNWQTFLGYAKQLTKSTGSPQNDTYAIVLDGTKLNPRRNPQSLLLEAC